MYIEFDIPEISEHASGFPQYWMKNLFIQSPSNRYQINALTSTYVRLVEAAIFEYNAGNLELRKFWSTNTSINLSAMHKSISHFETCISNMHRATNCFRRLRRDRLQDPLSKVLNSQTAEFATDAITDIFRNIRNDIHHLEEKIMDERISNGQPFALMPDGPETAHTKEDNQTIKRIDRLIIGTNEVEFSNLAKWLREMASFVIIIEGYLPSTVSPSTKA